MATASRLLALPGELRNLILELYLAQEPTVAPPPVSRSPLAIALTCRQLYNETHTLAFAATTFHTRHWTLVELTSKLQRVRPALQRHIRSIELNVAADDFISRRCSLEGLQFAKAGLSYVEELYIRFSSGTSHRERAGYLLMNLGVLVVKTASSCRNNMLRRICIVHDGLMPWTVVGLFEEMKGRGHKQTQFRYDEDQHRFHILWKEVSKQRDVAISIGRTVREAEMYHQVRQQLLEGLILSNVNARLPDGVDSSDLDAERLVCEIDQMSCDFALPTPIDTNDYY